MQWLRHSRHCRYRRQRSPCAFSLSLHFSTRCSASTVGSNACVTTTIPLIARTRINRVWLCAYGHFAAGTRAFSLAPLIAAVRLGASVPA